MSVEFRDLKWASLRRSTEALSLMRRIFGDARKFQHFLFIIRNCVSL
jgi:hypothetical protein